jgi:1-acyl-sn-glycerol-3-phosphate acyltransferase
MRIKLLDAVVYYTARALTRLILTLRCGVECHGGRNVPRRGPCIIACNHASYLDPPVIAMAVPQRWVRFLARDSLLSNPVAKWFFTSIRCILIDRDRGDVAAMKQVLRQLGEGHAVALFPEGTRTRDGRLQPAKRGIGFLLSRSKVDVVPMYLDGTYDAYPKGAGKLTPHRIRAFVGEPIPSEEIAKLGTGKEAYAQAADLVMNRIAALESAAG